MTITIEISPELADQITALGEPVDRFAAAAIEKAVAERCDESNPNASAPKTMADALAGYIGRVHGTATAPDGRPWSEIEAPCDPL